jgi:hypothetical protein
MLRGVIIILLAALTSIAGWWTHTVREQLFGAEEDLNQAQERVASLEVDLDTSRKEVFTLGREVEEKSRRIAELRVRLKMLKVDHRVARIEVIEQITDPDDPERIITTIRFTEVGKDGEPVGPAQEITLEGTKLYLETQVIKFEDDYVEAGEYLRGTSLCLFRRMFSDMVPPVDGVEIEASGTLPHPYTGGDGADELFQAELWEHFWEYANDSEAAAEKGVRAIHGEAPFMEMREGKSYEVELRSSGGLSIRPQSR